MYSMALMIASSTDGIPQITDLVCNEVMKTVEEIRRDWLLRLIEKYGSLAELNGQLGRARTDATLAQIKAMSPNKSGVPRQMGSDLARDIETTLGLERGQLDHELSPEAQQFASDYLSLSPEMKLHLQTAMAMALLSGRSETVQSTHRVTAPAQ